MEKEVTDQCRYCTHKGDLEACEGAECMTHDSWYVLGLKESVRRLTEALVALRVDIRAIVRGVELALGEAERDSEKHPLAVDCTTGGRRIGDKMVDATGVLVEVSPAVDTGLCRGCTYYSGDSCTRVYDRGDTIGCDMSDFIFREVK